MPIKVRKPRPNYTEIRTPFVDLYFTKDIKSFKFGLFDWEFKWFNVFRFTLLVVMAVALVGKLT